MFLDWNNEITFGKILQLLCNRLACLISKYRGYICTGMKQRVVTNHEFLSSFSNPCRAAWSVLSAEDIIKDAKISSSTTSAFIIIDYNVNNLNIPLQIYIFMPFFFSHSEKLQLLSLIISRLLSICVIRSWRTLFYMHGCICFLWVL